MCVRDMVNILCKVGFLTFMKTWLKLCQKVVRVLGGVDKILMGKMVLMMRRVSYLMGESGTYSTSGVLWGYS